MDISGKKNKNKGIELLSRSEISEIFEIFKKKNPAPKSELTAPNNYTFLVSVVLSAQSTDKSVNKATKELYEKIKTPEEMPESYKSLPPEAQIVGSGEWIFLDEALDAIDNFSFDVFIGYATNAKSDRPSADTIYLYKDQTEHYQTEYPDAGVKTVVISYAVPSMM